MKLIKLSALALLAGTLLALVPMIGPASADTASWSCFHSKTAERRFTKKMNNARDNHGLGKFQLDKQLSKVARQHTAAMVKQREIFHSSQTKLGQKVTRWYTLSENVGRGGTVSSTHEAFMNSSGHRANILYSSFKHIGVGTKEVNGVIYVTVVFESSRDPGTTLSPPSC